MKIGMVFGRLIVLRAAKMAGRFHRWKCLCSCGNKTIVYENTLKSGSTRSCGCLSSEIHRKHGHTFPRRTPTWKSWMAMRGRCRNKNSRDYKNYGGRGIKVCHRWNKFVNFLADMGLRPKGRSLDRYPNNDGDYKPSNCRWATARQQARNKHRVV